MKLLSVTTPDGPRLAAKVDAGIVIFSETEKLSQKRKPALPLTLQEALASDGSFAEMESQASSILSHPDIQKYIRPENQVAFTQLYAPRNILCVGLNYKDHVEESKTPLPQQPVFFAKWVNAASENHAPIVLPPDTTEVDYEAELAVVIGRRCRSVSAETALDYVAGYTCMNDVSARDFQRGDGQWVRAKSQDTFGPFGPYLVTKTEIPDPQVLPIRCTVNGRLLQNSNTSKMIFGVRELIAFISRGVTLYPGDLISTGTPHGVGFAHNPPVFLHDGDEVVVEIDGIGRLSNPVKAM
ncbi:fumarylacetoacetate hydrolase family protein [Acidobacterium sp. S8]|jgi:2-keto-4-pentenoate hydratase/2-oxohepta-3-ene-1,7-dioic acid hydratase in catechol pathway|uniref:fumarylacetoacetate hydrolase family protein n=1 Tax=Acidobacterium sp. S8 TaxID=1641854 RepID=UPI001C20884D|nr:fumarylacetoacetate hydrolase family protein [Acidobacterium sp. S8]